MRQKRAERRQTPGWLCSLLPAVFFLLGAAAGIFCANRVSGNLCEELSAYLQEYLSLSQKRTLTIAAVCALAWAYIRWPVFAFFCGFTTLGVVLLPMAAAAFGFFSAYAAGCLTVAFGSRGILAALALFGLRCCVTVPCFFLLAAYAWRLSAALFRVSFARGHPFSPIYDRQCWTRFAGVCVCLCIGICIDLQASPLVAQVLLKLFS